ncbi:MAG: hypothetical protein IPI73_14465 [Betaproteobacteria bacterium]|nr:hypothetical protein [Betaproteobacteria bacterium]
MTQFCGTRWRSITARMASGLTAPVNTKRSSPSRNTGTTILTPYSPRSSFSRSAQRLERGLDRLSERFGIGDARLAAVGAGYDPAIARGQNDGTPLRACREHPLGAHAEPGDVIRVELRRSREQLQAQDRAAQLAIDRGGERARDLDARAFDLRTLLLDQRDQAESG